MKNGYSGALKRPRVVYKDPVDMAAGMVRGDLGTPASGTGGPWSQSAEDAADKYLNREKFQYDVNEDALYHQYKDLYTMQGQQAMVDTMGQAATLTGGYGNSYAPYRRTAAPPNRPPPGVWRCTAATFSSLRA